MASDEVLSMLLNKLGITLVDNSECDLIKNKISTFFEYFFQMDTKAIKIAEDLLNKEDKLEGSNTYLYFQIFKLYAQELLKKDLNISYDLDKYEENMNPEEQRLFYIYKVWLNQPINIIEEDDGKRILYLKGLAQREKQKKNWFQAYSYLQEAYTLASKKFYTILICDLLLDMGNLCVSDLDMMKKNFDNLIQISSKYLSKQYSQFYNGYKSVKKDNSALKRSYIEKLFVTSCLLHHKKNADKWFLCMQSCHYFFTLMHTLDFEKNEEYRNELLKLIEAEKDIALWRYLLKRNSVLTHHWKEAYQQERWFFQQIMNL